MAERIIQYRFDDHLRQIVEHNVTPPGFMGLEYPQPREAALPERVGRFVREAPENKQITSPTDMADYLMQYIFTPWNEFPQEELWITLLDTKNIVRHDVMVYRGTINSTLLRVGETFREAVRLNAANLIISHNHPSGLPDPSPEDIQSTKRLIEAGKILDIPVLDHLIIGETDWVSLKEQELGIWKP